METKHSVIAGEELLATRLPSGPQLIRFSTFRASEPLAPAGRFRALHEILEAQADARPDANAVVCAGANTTYAALERRANRLARCLRARGVRRGGIVALLLPRSVDAYAAWPGILKAGAAGVPLDPEYPADRVACVLENSGARALVTTAERAARHPAFSGKCARSNTSWRSRVTPTHCGTPCGMEKMERR